ncbi:putative NADH-flavin reductase [Nocardia amikacinitolerans]|uniref:NAD(P)-dependent oxidoreductase n=1 Tax=Nocardia amikacinitolerans TaxID=756689 RepID=UPI0008338CA3|nr:SDR family oxidoreductase [Nocardia amikacinitolerans]MCP2321073.1 putative NADH-flavin reductase [Nocardia amikacinitolerans]
MKIAVFGATGSVGRLVVEQALEQGHEVTAFTRNAAGVTQRHERLRVVEGDVFDTHQAEKAVVGQDAVVIALGDGRKGKVRFGGTKAVVDAMHRTGVQRLICQSTLGVGDSRDNLNFLWKHVLFGMLLRRAYNDHVQQEAYVRSSGLDWTIVRPSAFTDGPRTGSYRRAFPGSARGLTLKIARADIAEFLLEQLTDSTYLHRAPGISH